MQLIFLCLFIFQDWLWNVGSRQKPHQPLLSIRLLHPPFFPLLTLGAYRFPKPHKHDPMWRNATPKLFRQQCHHPTLRVLPLHFCLYSFFICSFPTSLTLALPLSWLSDHIPLTELKSCITLKTPPMHCGYACSSKLAFAASLKLLDLLVLGGKTLKI